MNAPRGPQIFLCHASEDKSAVQRVYAELLRLGYSPWLDKESLLPGQDWREEIPKAIRSSDFVLVFLSTASTAKRGYVQKEFKIALDVLDEVPEGRVYVIPVKLDDCKIPERFSNLHWAALYDSGGLQRVLRAVDLQWEKIRSTQSALAAAATPLDDLVESTKSAIGRLEDSLLAISEETMERYREYSTGQDCGVVKLLAEGRYAKSVSIRNGGAWYSFSRASHEQHNEADLCLRERAGGTLELVTGFKGMDYGFLLDLGDYPLDDLTCRTSSDFAPPAFEAAWRFLWGHVPPGSMKLVRLEGFKARHGVPLGEAIISESAAVRSGTTYVLRSITHKNSDLLVALRTERVDPDSTLELIWKVLHRFAVPNASGPEPYPYLTTMADLLIDQMGVRHSEVPSLTSLSLTQQDTLRQLVEHQRYNYPSTHQAAADMILLQAAGLLAVWPPVKEATQLLRTMSLIVLATTAGHSLIAGASTRGAA